MTTDARTTPSAASWASPRAGRSKSSTVLPARYVAGGQLMSALGQKHCPQKRTLPSAIRMSALCQEATYAMQQTRPSLYHLVGSASSIGGTSRPSTKRQPRCD
jgi:hypothetical protein